MDDVHTFEGVCYIPIKVIIIKGWKWVFAIWLSNHMSNFGYQKKKLTDFGLSTTVVLGSRAGDYMRLD